MGINATNFATAIPDNQYGSAIKSTFTNINAGDVFSFNWNFTSADTDQAFVTINNNVQTLTDNSLYSYTFTSAGNYNIGIGVVDTGDSDRKSVV